MSSIIKGLVDEQGVEETKKLSAQEKFKRSMKRAGYDMDAGAKRLQDLLAKQKKEREEFEKKEVKEDETLQYAAEVTPKVSPYAGVRDNKFRGAIGEGIKRMFEEPNESPTDSGYQQGGWRKMNEEEVSEDLRKWFKEKWVRFGPDGKIRGACARGSSSEGKPKCLPQAKAHALGKKGRKYAAAKKRREDPNPERSGPAKNVATKKKSNEGQGVAEGLEQDYLSQIPNLSWKPVSRSVWNTIQDEGLDEEQNAPNHSDWLMASLSISPKDIQSLQAFDDNAIEDFNRFDIRLKSRYPGLTDLIDYDKGTVTIVKPIKRQGVAEGLINEKIAEGIVYATGPRSHGINDVDLIFKNLRTKKIVASLLGNNDHGGIYEIKIDQNGLKPQSPINFVATGNPQDGSGEHVVYKLSSNRGNDAKEFSTMRNGFDTRNNTYYGMKMDFIGDDDYWSFLENMIGDIMWEDDAIEAGYVDRLDNGDLVFVKNQGVAEGYSDISGLLSASNLNKSFIITAELAEGGKKKFRVKAQNERVAIEKFKKHHSMAKIINVAEEGVEEGSKYPRNPTSYHLKKYPVPQDQLARPVKKKDEKVDKDKPKEIKEGTDEVRRIQQFLNKNYNANLDVDGVMGNLTLQSIKKFLPAAKEKLAPNPNKNTKVQGYQNKNQMKEAEIDEACWKGYHKEGNKKMFGKTYPNCVKNTNEEQEGLAEAFDQPYKLKWYPGDMDEVTAYAEIPNGDDLSIMFNLDANEEGEEAWSVEFYRNNSQEVTGEGDAQRVFATVLGAIQTFIKKYKPNRIIFSASKDNWAKQQQGSESRASLYDRLVQRYAKAWGFRAFRADAGDKVHYELNKIAKNVAEEQLDEKCWDTHKQVGMKNKGGKMVPNCVPKESVEEGHQQCPECGGAMYEVSLMNEKKDACYYKVKSRYKVWPSAYASGALVKCRKKGAKNWGSKSNSNEGQIYSTGGGAGQAQRYYTPKDNLGETKSNILSGIFKANK